MSERERVTDRQLNEYWQQLKDSIGHHQPVSGSVLGQMQQLFVRQEFSKCILEIKLLYKLMMTLQIGYLKEKKAPVLPNLDLNFSMPQFEFGVDPTASINQLVARIQHQVNHHLAAVAGYIRGQFHNPAKEVPAWVVVPGNLPLYGSRDFDNSTVTMYVERSFTREIFQTFVYGIAHEMAHILLWALRHPLAQSEIATDLVVVVMGFGEVFRKSRESGPHLYGYLDNQQLDLALRFR